MPDIGDMIAELRQDRGLRQKDLARVLHLAESSISNFETGQRLPKSDSICRICDYFNVSADYLLGRSEANLSPDIMTQEYIKGESVEKLLEKLLVLDDERRVALCKILEDVVWGARIQNRD